MECKNALKECGGDIEKAKDSLRKAGIAKAGKKASRTTSEGWIGHYVHTNGKIGVLIEVKCETDFVAKNEQFQQLIRDLSMHIAAMNPMAVDSTGLDPALIEKERSFFIEEVKDKPAEIQDKIVDGKLKKYFSEVCLVDQAFVKEDKKTVGQYITEVIARVGENITLGRFARMELGGE